jgi:lipoic acid synthetase
MDGAVPDSLPAWLKIRPPTTQQYAWIRTAVASQSLHTVCQEAHCPNMAECWSAGTATFMVLGDTCTRGCRFCAVRTAAKGTAVDPFEPHKLAATVRAMNLNYVVITSVDRDELPDQGATHFAQCVRAIKKENPKTIVEVLTPDFRGEADLVRIVAESGCEVFGHNLETVERLQGTVRDRRAGYAQSLAVLRAAKEANPEVYTKSALMMGLGEKEDEVLAAFDHLLENGVSLLSLGQYLRPSGQHVAVAEYVPPAVFDRYREAALGKGFLFCTAGPLVRSSYRAGEFFMQKQLLAGKNPAFGHG